MLDIKPYKVYVKTDEKGRITAINSDVFLHTLEGWQEIDRGNGDRYPGDWIVTRKVIYCLCTYK